MQDPPWWLVKGGGSRVRAFWKNPLDFGVRSWDDMDRHELADAARGCGAGVGRRLHRADIAPNEDGDIARADILFADQHDVGGLHHRVGCLDRPDEPLRLDHSQRFLGHSCSQSIASRTLPDFPFRRAMISPYSARRFVIVTLALTIALGLIYLLSV